MDVFGQTSTEMNIISILFMRLFWFLDGYNFLVLIESSNIEHLFEIDFFRPTGLPLRRLSKILLKLCVELVKVLSLLGSGHKEQFGKLRVVHLELFLQVHRHRVYVICYVEIVVFLLHLLVFNYLLRELFFWLVLTLPIGLKVGSQELLRIEQQRPYFGHLHSFRVAFCTKIIFT